MELAVLTMIQIFRISTESLALDFDSDSEGGVGRFPDKFRTAPQQQQLRFSFIGVVGSAREFGISVPFSAV